MVKKIIVDWLCLDKVRDTSTTYLGHSFTSYRLKRKQNIGPTPTLQSTTWALYNIHCILSPVRLSGDDLQCPCGTFQCEGTPLYLLTLGSVAGEGGGSLRGS